MVERLHTIQQPTFFYRRLWCPLVQVRAGRGGVLLFREGGPVWREAEAEVILGLRRLIEWKAPVFDRTAPVCDDRMIQKELKTSGRGQFRVGLLAPHEANDMQRLSFGVHRGG